MKKGIKLLSSVVLGLAAVACSSPEKMADMAENVTVKCDPAVLEVVAGEIDATVSVTYPADYFHPKAILEVTPVLVYEGGEAAMEPFMYKGEKVLDNYKSISSEGQTVTEKVHFTYVPGMEKGYLELRGVVIHKKKSVNLPVKKVADGTNTTYMLVNKEGKLDYIPDSYQEIIKQTAEGQILYTINSSTVRNSQLKSESIKSFQEALDEINANERKEIVSTDIIAYASPDGGEELNAKLSDKRSTSAEKAYGKVTKGHEVEAPVNVKSIGQDWEGFQELVAQSDIADKDLIIRVLSMYSDPAVREKEIKNMSAVYQTLAKEILPELRRARFIANVEFTNYSNEELLQLIEENIDVLDEEALLRAASVAKENSAKADIYKKAINKYGSDRAQYNLAVVYLKENKLDAAKSALAEVKDQNAYWQNAMGVVALREGNAAEAAKYFNAAGTQTAKENLAVLDILNGNYAAAAEKLADAQGCCHNKTLAYILTGQLDKAAASAKCASPSVSYLKAIIAARQGNAEEVKANLEAAGKVEALAERAAKDIEFAQYR
ncbi:MAG: hypothetical protein IAC07_04315 [Bacteroidetes bacterium]|uniref:Tetratricopeptide repeat protein n=1 Tax=Candidatus Cryptobacteroides gallistercoris TaxID=2840765 RepID=A0A940DN75_9BACT|nr:hypothetical protein [Candidatus Cryptobacteroides gallistercoris]